MSQTVYTQDISPALAGLIADSGPTDIMTGENFAAAIPFGVFVSRDTTAGDNRIKVPAASADVTDATKARGIAIAQQALESSESGVPQYPIKSAIPVLKKGRVWVTVEEGVAPTDPVFVRFAAGAGGTQLGSFRKSADTATAVALPNAKYLTTGLAAGLAIVEVNN